MRFHHHFIVAILMNFNDFVNYVRQFDSSSVHFDSQLLAEIYLDVSHFKCDGLRPTGMFSLSRIVCHPNRECVINAISCELVFAGALKAKKFPIKCLVMWIAENGADSWAFDALSTTMALSHNEILIGSALYIRTLSLCTANFTGATLARLTWPEIPRFIVLCYG